MLNESRFKIKEKKIFKILYFNLQPLQVFCTYMYSTYCLRAAPVRCPAATEYCVVVSVVPSQRPADTHQQHTNYTRIPVHNLFYLYF